MKLKATVQTVLVLSFLLCLGCAVLPPIDQDLSPGSETLCLSEEMAGLFPAGSFQFIHSLELTLPGNHSAMLLGVLNITTQGRTIHCVIMTLEGLVLFEAQQSKKGLETQRSVPPFDKPGFARGLIQDIQLIFLRPEGQLLASGQLSDQQRILRFSGTDEGTIDVIRSQNKRVWTLNSRTKRHRIKRTVQYLFPGSPVAGQTPVFPKTITLTAAAPSRYSLTMTLIDAHLLSNTSNPR